LKADISSLIIEAEEGLYLALIKIFKGFSQKAEISQNSESISKVLSKL
jgi:hypothetical protein